MASLSVGSEVLVRVERLYSITAQKAEVTVIAIIKDGTSIAVPYPIRGAIRIQDARSFDIDKATIADHFQPGDIVKAVTLSTGDAKSCFFATTGADYGVVMARENFTGEFLVPVDQSHMRNPDNTVIYKRKVARPIWLPATAPSIPQQSQTSECN
jgi:exosome complex RNA-binding protein Csl4